MLRHGTTTFEAKSGYGLDRDTELASLRAIRAAGGIPTWLGAHAVPPEFDGDADAYLDFAARRGAARGGAARRGRRRLPRARRLRRGAGAPLSRGVPRRRPRAAAARRPVHRAGRDRARDRARRPLGRPSRGDGTGRCRGRSPRAASPASCCRRARSSSDRPMPPGRALVDAGAAVALATDFNPGSAFCESLPLCCSLAATQLKLSPAEALAACTVNAAHVLGRADRLGRLAPGFRADIVLLDAPDWRYLAYHLGGDIVDAVVLAGDPWSYASADADEEAEAPRGEGEAARVRVRVRRLRRPRARGRSRRRGDDPEEARRPEQRLDAGRAAEGQAGAAEEGRPHGRASRSRRPGSAPQSAPRCSASSSSSSSASRRAGATPGGRRRCCPR